MVRVGNDIVDLKSPFAKDKSKDQRFVQRVLTETEQRFIGQFPCPDDMLWMLWAAKETAYKAISKSVPGISSAPRRYAVSLGATARGNAIKGVVKTPDQRIQVRVYHHGDAIHCIGKTGPWNGASRVVYGIGKMDDSAAPDYCQSSNHVSTCVRRLATEVIAGQLACDERDITIFKASHSDGRTYPAVRIMTQHRPMDISFSHDGRYVAYAFSAETSQSAR